MKKCVKWFLLVGILFCLLGTGIVTAGLMKGGARNAKAYAREYAREYYDHAEEIEEQLDDYVGDE